VLVSSAKASRRPDPHGYQLPSSNELTMDQRHAIIATANATYSNTVHIDGAPQPFRRSSPKLNFSPKRHSNWG
jgi:hypothetical protein